MLQKNQNLKWTLIRSSLLRIFYPPHVLLSRSGWPGLGEAVKHRQKNRKTHIMCTQPTVIPQNIQPVLISVQISADLSVLSTRTLNSFIFDSVIIQYFMLICKEKHIGIIPYFHKKYAIIKKCSLKVLLMH